ncbi:MAG: TonB-dependent receptor [Vicinamibacterales bacterium]
MAAFEASHDDGPSEVPDDFTRWKALAKYSAGDEARRLSMTFAGYRASWFATDGYPQRALDRGYLTRFGTLDASDGGRTQQYMLVASSRRTDDRQHLDIGAYGRYYDLDLFSNLTFWTRSPESGDQIWQADRRTSIGGHAISSRFLGRRAGAVEVTAGAQVRHDLARVRLRNTVDRVPQAKTVLSGAPLPAVVYDDRIADTSMSPFADLRLRPLAWLRANIGVRADTVRMRVVSDRTENSGTTWASIVTPKASVILGPWRATEIYANAGSGFHSNHAAGVMQRVDPLTGSAIRADGTIVAGSPPLVCTVGAEAGIRTELGTILRTSIALWLLDSDSELIYTAEDGVTSPERPGRRYGIEWLNVLQLRSWLGADLDAAWSHARYRTDPLREGRLIPDAAAAVVGGGVTVSRSRIGAAIRARYVGRRPLLPSGHSFMEGSSIVNGQAEVRVSSRVRINVQAFNIFDRRYEDTAYYFATRLRDPNTGIVEHDAVGDYVTHPGQPRTVRAGLRIVF